MERKSKGDQRDEQFTAEIEAVKGMSETWPIPKMAAAKLAAIYVNGTDVTWYMFERLGEYLSRTGVITYMRFEDKGKNRKFMDARDVVVVIESHRFIRTHNKVGLTRGGRQSYLGLVEHLKSTGLTDSNINV